MSPSGTIPYDSLRGEASDLIWLFLPPSDPHLTSTHPLLFVTGTAFLRFLQCYLETFLLSKSAERRRNGKWEGWESRHEPALEWLWFLHPVFLSFLSLLSLHSYPSLVSYQALWQLKYGLTWHRRHRRWGRPRALSIRKYSFGGGKAFHLVRPSLGMCLLYA